MQELITSIKQVMSQKAVLPFSVYSSFQEQNLFNVPIIKPLLIFVLDGSKKLGKDNELNCPSGSFIFLSNSPTVDMRNIPHDKEYFALLIEFEYTDFDCFLRKPKKTQQYLQGEIDSILANTLQQFVEWSAFAPATMWPIRRQEILQLIYQLGYEQVSAIIEPPSLSHKLHGIISADISAELTADDLSSRLAMSPSTLRRKLSAEGINLQAIKDRVKLGYGLHLVQTSSEPIGVIAEKCGYYSQSRFTDRFKQLFGLTPTELRKTRLRD
ncbi:MAG: helix-turn-helix transcriptional regulator [Cellvibrionaceae bacterium]